MSSDRKFLLSVDELDAIDNERKHRPHDFCSFCAFADISKQDFDKCERCDNKLCLMCSAESMAKCHKCRMTLCDSCYEVDQSETVVSTRSRFKCKVGCYHNEIPAETKPDGKCEEDEYKA